MLSSSRFLRFAPLAASSFTGVNSGASSVAGLENDSNKAFYKNRNKHNLLIYKPLDIGRRNASNH